MTRLRQDSDADADRFGSRPARAPASRAEASAEAEAPSARRRALATARGLAPIQEVLPNGARVLVKESRTAPAVTIHVAVQAGTIFDPPDRIGTAHYLSRVLDRGTSRRGADEIAEILDAGGVSLQINVSRHVMTLVCSCLAEDFEPILEVLGEIVRAPTCPPDEVETRRAEIVTAIRQDQDNPAVVAVERLIELLYGPSHPYAWRSKGALDVVSRIGRDDLVAFHAAQFAPSALSLVIVGDVVPSQAMAAATRVFGDWRHDAAARPALPAVVPVAERRQVVVPMMNKAQADLAYGFVAIARRDPAYHAFWVMNNVLGQYSLGGRLGDNIRERQGMAYYVFSALDASHLPGPLLIRAGISPANVDRALAAVDQEVARMAAEGITGQELAETKRYLIGSLPRMLETNAGIATFLQTVVQFDLGLDYDLRLPDLLGSVTLDEANATARQVLAPERAAMVIAGPYEGAGG